MGEYSFENFKNHVLIDGCPRCEAWNKSRISHYQTFERRGHLVTLTCGVESCKTEEGGKYRHKIILEGEVDLGEVDKFLTLRRKHSKTTH
ncbi:MAG: hypothetical protein KKF68_00540 [Nanoarchaeota archaeon]|nr:hypothetical protein [Nanoarchaeota archaeon]